MTYSPSPGRHHMSSQDGWPPTRHPLDERRPGGYPPGSSQAPDPGWWDHPAPAPHPAYAPPPATAPYGQHPRTQPASAYGPAPGSQPDGYQEWAGSAKPTEAQVFWAGLRRQVASKLQFINSKHCHTAFERFGRRDALSPHGVVFFYATAAPQEPGGYRLHFVTRMAFAGPEFDDLALSLHGLTAAAARNIAMAHRNRRSWDPRGPEDSLVNSGDMDMPRNAAFVGTGVTSLDTDKGDWYTVANAIYNTPSNKSVFDIPGRCLALLTDDTALKVIRDPDRRLGDDGITCSKTLDAYRIQHWNRFADLTTQGDQDELRAWARLTDLHHTLRDYLPGLSAEYLPQPTDTPPRPAAEETQ